MADVFNNPSNDYINPGLAPCSNVADSNAGDFRFIDDGAGVVVGKEIVQFMDLSDINIRVTEWSSKKETLQSGEVIYVPGLEKGLMNKTQVFEISPAFDEEDSQYYYIVDLSINYYYNFRYYSINLEASSNYSSNIDITNALNIIFGNKNIKAEVNFVDNKFSFSGTQVGYDFEISNVELTLIDASMDSTSPFVTELINGERIDQTYTLLEDTDAALPSAKYPNGAMLGYMLKAKYPSTECYRDFWIYMNHVESPFTVFLETSLISVPYDISTYKTLQFDPSITWGPFINYIDIIDPEYINEIINLATILDSSVLDSSISNSSITTSLVKNTDISAGTISLSYLENVILNNSLIEDSSIIDSLIQKDTSIYNTTIQNSWFNGVVSESGDWSNDVDPGVIEVNYGIILDTSIYNTTVYDTSIYTSEVYDSSLIRCTIYNSIIHSNSSVIDSRTIQINSICDSSISWSQDVSTFYEKYSKRIDVGMSGNGNTTTLSAADYLDYVNSNNFWFKVGPFSSRFSALDHPNTQQKNLIGGFYLFNPQSFTINIEYMILNRIES